MKRDHSRREFISVMAAGIASVVSGRSLSAEPFLEGKDPDLVVFNAKIYTMDSRPRSAAFAVNAGRFVLVGSDQDVKALAGKNTEIFDARQMTIVPGFIDCHNHARENTLPFKFLFGNRFKSSSSPSPVSSKSSEREPAKRRLACGSKDISSMTRR